jgi:carbon monoxide dehydrogenase subunit G
VNISANANVSGKAASMGEGTVQAVLTQLVKQFAGNLAKA